MNGELNKKEFTVLILICIVVCFRNIYGQYDDRVNVHSIKIDSRDGLPTNHVNYVFKDRLGFYWIGTQSGLCKYDGYKIHLFKNNPKDSFSIKCSNIYTIVEYMHYIILGCDNGVSFYNYYTDKFIKIKQIDKVVGKASVYGLYVLNHKLYIINSTGFYEYNFKDSSIVRYQILSDNGKENIQIEFTSEVKMLKTSYHFLICDINVGIKKIDTISHTITGQYDYYNKEPRDIILYGNSIYVVYSGYGLVKVDAATLEKIGDAMLFEDVHNNILAQYTVVQLKNKLYVGHKDGVLEWDPLRGKIKFLYLEEKGSNFQVNRLFNIDNNLIITTKSMGMYIVPYSVQKIVNPIPDNINKNFSNAFAIIEYQPGKILIGGNEKLYLYNLLTNVIEKDFSKLFKNKIILCLLPSSKKSDVYIGTYGAGLLLLDMEKSKLKTIIPKGDYLSLFLKDKDTLWAGTFEEGLWKLNIHTEKYVVSGFLGKLSVNYIQKSGEHFWIATAENGLYKIDSKEKIIEHLSTKNKKLSDDWVYHLTEDSTYVFIATDNGLTLYNKKDSTSRFFYDSDGLFSSTTLSVYLDKQNNLWVGTLKGISKMIVSRLNNPVLKLFYNYSYIEGLVNYEFDQNAHTVLKNNYLVYGGSSGLDIFNPLKLRPSFSSIPIYITSFKKSGREYITDTNVIFKRYFELDWRQNNFQIEVTAISPLGSDKIQYKYKLEGYDEEYSPPSTVRYISYTGLPGGTYKLNILATNHDGEWNTIPYYIYIKVVPPFWKTPWFIVSASVLVFGGIFGFNQYRTYQIKKRNKELEEKVKERTKELANKNHEILSSIEYAKRIQQAILPSDKYVKAVLPNAFILYKPKDIVSGDFYWVYEVHSKFTSDTSVIVAAVDCTGHGVPGALMSMIGNNLLNQIVIEKNITSPEKILQEMNKGVQNALKQGQSDIQTNDGMDASVLQLFKNGTALWAGAYRPLVIVRNNGQLEKIEGDKYPIGGVQINEYRNYTLHRIQIRKDDSLYLFSDGYADQFGGDKGKKMMMKKFLQLLVEIHTQSISEQKILLETYFNQWKGLHDQVDDVLVIGIKM